MLCFFKNGGFFLGVFKGEVLCIIFLLLKPQTGQSAFVGRKQNFSERGAVMHNICHGFHLGLIVSHNCTDFHI